MYTRINEDTPEGTDMREAAFLNMFLTEFGQQTFVEDVNYITLPTSDIEAEREAPRPGVILRSRGRSLRGPTPLYVTYPQTDWRASIERRLTRTQKFIDDTDPEALAVVLVSMGSLLAAFVGFLLASPWTAVPLGTFLIATGYGWARHQALVARAVTFAMTTVTLVTLGLIVVFIFAESIPAFQYETASVFGVSVRDSGCLHRPVGTPSRSPFATRCSR